jgi:hypothetical protein
MNADTLRSMVLNLISSAVLDAPTVKKAGKAKAGSRRTTLAGKQPASPHKARAATRTKSAPTPVVEGVECGPIEFRKGAATKQGREYVLIYADGKFAGSLRVDDAPLLRNALSGLRQTDVARAIRLAVS